VSEPLQYALFGLVAATVLVPAVLVVTVRNLVRAAFWLLPAFLGVAAAFLLLGADFLAMVQVLIYAGAIMLLLLFVLMLTRSPGDARVPQSNRLTLWAGVLCTALALAIVVITGASYWPVASSAPAPGFTRAVGEALLGPYLLPFEVASVLLLSAMVGAIVIARKEASR